MLMVQFQRKSHCSQCFSNHHLFEITAERNAIMTPLLNSFYSTGQIQPLLASAIPESSRTQLGRVQGARAARLLASSGTLLKSGTHVDKLEHKRRSTEYVPGSMALKDRLWVSAAVGETGENASLKQSACQRCSRFTCKRTLKRRLPTQLPQQPAAPCLKQTRCHRRLFSHE
jgi:hypothetical protein